MDVKQPFLFVLPAIPLHILFVPHPQPRFCCSELEAEEESEIVATPFEVLLLV